MQRDLNRLMLRKGEPLAATPHWWKPARCARLLMSAAELAVEGKVMQHCVAGYAGYVRRGESVIVALNVCEHRSTVELDRAGHVRQHKGFGNNEPHELCRRALAVLQTRWLKGARA
jgi:hypothetical protein